MPNISTAFYWAVDTCNAPNVGYSQAYRNQRTVNGITYYDCSSFIWYALLAGGFPVVEAYNQTVGKYEGNAITTPNMSKWCPALGFQDSPLNEQWLPGDIMWRQGHTEMVYEGHVGEGRTMGAHTANTSLPNQVSINSGYSSNWTKRYSLGEVPSGDKQISPEVVAAICGNWWQESTLNPGIWQGLKPDAPGYGLGQWTDNAEVHRKTDLFNWLDSHGFARDSGEGQLQFFIEENIWYKSGVAGQFNNLQDFLYTTNTDIDFLTEAFMRGWEGINDGTLSVRQEAARKCYQYILQNANNASITTWFVGNRYLPDIQRYNNAVLIYRQLGSGGGGGGDIPIPPPIPGRGGRSTMRAWMYLRKWY